MRDVTDSALGNRDYNPRPGRLIENVRVEDVDVTTGAVTAGDEEPLLVGGYDAEHPVSGVHVVNMRRDGRACHTLEEANIRVLPQRQRHHHRMMVGTGGG